MADEATNLRGPCSSCGAPLATDQRYCVECGQRVGPPLALPYLLPPGVGEPPGAAKGWAAMLPMPIQMMSTFAAIALGFGVVVGTAISPNVAGIVAAPAPTVVAQAPPPETPPAPPAVGGGGSVPPSSAVAATTGTATAPTSGGGGGGGGGGHKKKKKQQQGSNAVTLSGTVVRVNPVAGSYTLAGGVLNSIHADSLPSIGDQLEVPASKLANGTWSESGARNHTGSADSASFSGTVTYCADLEHPSALCDGSSATDHYVYTVSGVGSSVLVSAPHPATGAPPAVGSVVDEKVHLGDPFQAIDPVNPSDWASDNSCTPPYDEQNGRPSPPVKAAELSQTSVNVTSQAQSATVEAVLQTVCPGGSPKLVLSADDVRSSGRDLAELGVPDGFDLGRLNPGQAVQADLGIAPGGSLSLKGITSDQGAGGANDTGQGQGSLAGA
jgi:hypothetical protein